MFKLFRKHKFSIYAVCDGSLISITDVKDEVFSTKMLGDGYAIKPINGKIYSPVSGTITTVFPTKHAIGITTEDNLEILIHLGLDTVALNGKPFEVFVSQGDVVKKGDHLADADLKMITNGGYDDTVITVLTNMDIIKTVSEISPGNIVHGQEVQTIELNN